MSKEKFSVSGMTCAACSAHVEKAVRNVAGVQEVSVSLLTNSMQVDFAAPATEQEICAAVAAAGYGAQPEHSAQSPGAGQGAATLSSRAAALEDQETPRLARRLVISLCLLLPLMYVSMGHGMWGWPPPAGSWLAMRWPWACVKLLQRPGYAGPTSAFSSAAFRACCTAGRTWIPWWPWAAALPLSIAWLSCF